MAVSFTGPIKNAVKNAGARQWMGGLPVGLAAEPDYIVLSRDFLLASDYAATDWVVTETQAGATQALVADVVGGAFALVNSAADDDVNQIQSAEEFIKIQSDKQLWFECKFKIDDATQSDLFIGFATTDTTIIAGTTDSIGFRKLDGTTSLLSITEDNTTETTNTLATMVADTYVTCSLHWDGKSAIRFYLNRELVSTHTANIEQTNKLALTFTVQNGEAAARTLTIDYFTLVMQR